MSVSHPSRSRTNPRTSTRLPPQSTSRATRRGTRPTELCSFGHRGVNPRSASSRPPDGPVAVSRMRRRGRVRGCLALAHAAAPPETEALHVQRRHSSSRVVLEVSLASAKQGYSRHRKNSTKRRRVVGASIGMTAPNGFARLPQEWSRCCSKPLAVVQPGRGGDTVSAEALHHLADVEELRIGFRRLDGSTRSVPIWVVRVGDDLYVRSVRGPDGGWYRRLRQSRRRGAGRRAPTSGARRGSHRLGHARRSHPRVCDQVRSQPVRSATARGGGPWRRPCVWTRPDDSPHRRTPPCE